MASRNLPCPSRAPNPDAKCTAGKLPISAEVGGYCGRWLESVNYLKPLDAKPLFRYVYILQPLSTAPPDITAPPQNPWSFCEKKFYFHGGFPTKAVVGVQVQLIGARTRGAKRGWMQRQNNEPDTRDFPEGST